MAPTAFLKCVIWDTALNLEKKYFVWLECCEVGLDLETWHYMVPPLEVDRLGSTGRNSNISQRAKYISPFNWQTNIYMIWIFVCLFLNVEHAYMHDVFLLERKKLREKSNLNSSICWWLAKFMQKLDNSKVIKTTIMLRPFGIWLTSLLCLHENLTKHHRFFQIICALVKFCLFWPQPRTPHDGEFETNCYLWWT